MRDADPSGFADWVRPHWTDMQLLARRLCGPDAAEDAVQEALAAAWRKRGQFDPARGTPRSWLLAVVADQAYKHRRRLRPTVELTDDLTGNPLHDGVVTVPAGRHDMAIDLSRVLLQLSRRQRLVVSLHYYLDLPVAETAEVMGCSVGTVKSTLSDARQRLRTLLGEDYR